MKRVQGTRGTKERKLKMRIIRMIVMMAAVLALGGVAQAARFQIPSGHVTYRMTGQQEGTEDLYWKNSGDRVANKY